MKWMNTPDHYGKGTRLFHWTVAALVIMLLLVGSVMEEIPKPTRFTVYDIHKMFGLITLVVMISFGVWTLFNDKPSWPNHMPRWEKALAKLVHLVLYITVIAMPIIGWIMSTAAGHIPSIFGLELPFPGIVKNKPLAHTMAAAHFWIAWVIASAIFLHLVGALKHHIIDSNNLLRRMLKGE